MRDKVDGADKDPGPMSGAKGLLTLPVRETKMTENKDVWLLPSLGWVMP